MERAAGAAGRDPGLQPERTRLAWRRTTLAWAVVTVLAGRQVVHRGEWSGAPGVLAVLAAVALVLPVFLLAAHRRIRALAAPRPNALSPRTAAAAAGCTVVLAVCAAALLR